MVLFVSLSYDSLPRGNITIGIPHLYRYMMNRRDKNIINGYIGTYGVACIMRIGLNVFVNRDLACGKLVRNYYMK